MITDPTIDDFSAWVNFHLERAEQKSLAEINKVIAHAAGKGMFYSGGTVHGIIGAVEKEFEAGVENALGELRRAIQAGKIDQQLLRQRTEASLREFLRRLKNQIGGQTNKIVAGNVGVVRYVDNKIAALDSYLNLHLRQFDTGLYTPNEPVREGTMIDNSIKIGGAVTGSAIQQGSPDAQQNLQANFSVFENVRAVVEQQISDPQEQEKISRALEEFHSLAKSQQKTSAALLEKYQKFMASAANHMTVLAPFLPALSAFLKP